jgi:restriction endonuclease S subunit
MKWKSTALGEVMRHRKGSITIEDTTTYKLCRVQVHRRGVVLRQELAGAGISTKKQQVCRAGDFLVAEMDAKVGGYGFVPPELDGAIVSSHYYLFEVDTKKLHPEFLEVVSQAEILQQQIVAKGSTNYSSIRPGSVLEWKIPLPLDLKVQKQIARNFQAIQSKLAAVSEEITHQQSLLAKLKQAILQEAIQGKLTADLPVRQAGWRDPKFLNLSGKRVPENATAHFAYVLECEDGSLYKGMCQDLWERVERHLDEHGSEWTTKNKPVALIHFEEFQTLAEARAKETYFKSGSGREWLKKIHQERRASYEPASQLLHRIQAEKARLIAAKKLKAGARQDAVDDDDNVPSIPPEWEFPHLDDISMLVTDGTHQTPTYTATGRIFLSAQNVKPFKFMPEQHKFVSEQAFAEYTNNRKAEKGDLLLARVGAGIGETAVIDRDLDFAFYVSLGMVKTFKEHIVPQYLAIVFNSPYGIRYAKGNTSSKGGSAGNFNLGRIRSFRIPLPPLAEQAAIVERVESLMATCRALEAEIEQARTHATHLLQAVLKEAFATASE